MGQGSKGQGSKGQGSKGQGDKGQGGKEKAGEVLGGGGVKKGKESFEPSATQLAAMLEEMRLLDSVGVDEVSGLICR